MIDKPTVCRLTELLELDRIDIEHAEEIVNLLTDGNDYAAWESPELCILAEPVIRGLVLRTFASLQASTSRQEAVCVATAMHCVFTIQLRVLVQGLAETIPAAIEKATRLDGDGAGQTN